ncbi:MAG: hypothetical protein QG597_3086, partial [Actinomycetota bacterium]|nr:hypothetical protein [Actinomycetota bacterium]
MTALAPDTPRPPLPRSLTPGAGESYPSWILRLSEALDLDPATLLHRIGANRERRSESALGLAYGVALTDEQMDAISSSSRCPPDTLRAMLLTRYDGGPIDLSPLLGPSPTSRSLREVALFEWASFTSSRACPDCLADTGYQWMLSWRMPWHHTCTTHRRLLVDECAGCGQPFMLSRRDRIHQPPLASIVPKIDACNNPLPPGVAVRSRTAERCGYPLIDQPSVQIQESEVLQRQDALLAHLNDRDRPRSWWIDMRALTALSLRYLSAEDLRTLIPRLPDEVLAAADRHHVDIADRRHTRSRLTDHRAGSRTRSFTDTPNESALLVGAVTVASRILDHVHEEPSHDGARTFEVLRGAVAREPGQTVAVLLRERGASEPLRTGALTLSGRNTLVVARNTGSMSHPPPTVNPDQIPWLWWPDRFAAIRDCFRDTLMTDDTAREYLSLAAVKYLNGCTWTDAAELLLWPRPRRALRLGNHNITELRRVGHDETVNAHVIATVSEFAETGTPGAVDYRQRAATITTLEPLDADTWDTIRSASGDTAPEYDTWTGRCALAFLWHHHG